MMVGSLSSLVHVLALVAAAPRSHETPTDSGAPREPSAEVCERAYHLFRPFPERCLGPIDTDRPHQTDTPHVVDPGHVQFESALVSLQQELDWEVNAGVVSARLEEKRRVLPVLATALTRDLVEDLSLFGEVRETSSDARLRVWDTYLDTGLLYHITRDVQIDGGSYFGVSGAAPALTLFTGFSVRQ